MPFTLPADTLSAGQVRSELRSGPVQGRAPFVEDLVICLEDVGHPGGDVEDDLDIGRCGSLRKADCVV